MSTQVEIELPPGFERMSRREQIEYAQRLWEYIDPEASEVPTPEWQLQIVRERQQHLRDYPSEVVSWDEVKSSVRQRLEEQRGS